MAELVFFTGTMDCGKSTLAPQMDHNHAARGRAGLIFSKHDRAGQSVLSSRLGLSRQALEVLDDTDFWDLVDETGTDVYAFGITADFRTQLFPGSQRLIERADDVGDGEDDPPPPGRMEYEVLGRRHYMRRMTSQAARAQALSPEVLPFDLDLCPLPTR